MGRLIDADKLRKQMSEDYAQGLSKISNPTVKAIVEKAVETFDGYVVSAETVEAIPVDWIEAQIPDSTDFYAVVTAIILRHLIDDYRKEKHNDKTE